MPARIFHSLVSFAYNIWCTLATFFQLLSAYLKYKQRLRNIDVIVTGDTLLHRINYEFY